ncbi:hypothetical protein C883_3311 [Bacillus stratosphericus LAMA 585]|nr:hypothetical protein C883_3311 [Bacillus stratosphericus LAMA 585]
MRRNFRYSRLHRRLQHYVSTCDRQVSWHECRTRSKGEIPMIRRALPIVLAVVISLTAAFFMKLSITPLKIAIILAFTIFAVCLKEYVYRLRKRIEEKSSSHIDG